MGKYLSIANGVSGNINKIISLLDDNIEYINKDIELLNNQHNIFVYFETEKLNTVIKKIRQLQDGLQSEKNYIKRNAIVLDSKEEAENE